MVTIKDVIAHLENVAPPVYQEDYDNAGLLTGNPLDEVKGVLTCLDATETVLDEAIALGCNLVVAHHPIIFRGLKRLTGSNYVERVVIKAIRHNLAIYAIHTNLDNVYSRGVNAEIAKRLGLVNTRILAPKAAWLKWQFVGPVEKTLPLSQVIIESGAEILDKTLRDDESVKWELRVAQGQARSLEKALADIAPATVKSLSSHPLSDAAPAVGSGMTGELPGPMPEKDFLDYLKDRMQVACIRHTPLTGRPIQRVALCGGAGSFLLRQAMGQADVFITGDYKYHEFFDADGRILIADIGHFESEQFTINLLQEIISQKFSNFAAYCTKVNTNPVHYY